MLSLLTSGLTGAGSSLTITDGLGRSTPVVRFVANLACLRLTGLSPAVMGLALAEVATLALSPVDPAAMLLVGLVNGELVLTNRASRC
jgi:hypothetical protein